MPPRAKKETLILLINIGVTQYGSENDPILLEKIKFIVQKIIERKIFLRPKDEIGVLLMGSSITNNVLDTEYVEEFTDVQIPNWDLLEQILHLKGTNNCSNWIEAALAAVKYIKTNVAPSSIKTLILLSDFNEEPDIISQFKPREIGGSLKDEQVQLLTVGKKPLDGTATVPLTDSEVFLKTVHKEINGNHVTFDDYMSELKFFKEISVNPSPWYSELELIDIRIPITTYVKVTEVNKFPSWKQAKDGKDIVRITRYTDRHRRVYDKSEITEGYQYGKKFFAAEKELIKDMSYESGPRSYKIHSFTSKNYIDLQFWCDCSTRIVVPSNRFDATPFYALVQAMNDRNLVAIVRKVYNNNCIPRMVALFPFINIRDEPWCLVEIEIPFAEDRRVMSTGPIKSVVKQLSQEQNDAVDSLLDSLILNKSDSDSYSDNGNHSFLPGCVPNPSVQHKWNMLSYRAINPEAALPPMEDYLKEIFEIPSVKERSEPHIKKIATLFQLESINPKEKEKREDKFARSDNMEGANSFNVEQPVKTDDKLKSDFNDDSLKDSVLSLDTSDIDLDELAANI